MPNFQMPIKKPEEIKPRLRKPEHWRKGRSAFELSTAWMTARGIPQSVRSVLDQASEWRNAALLDAIFERQTALSGRGGPTQTDLLGIVALKEGNAILGVEGKVDESFGDLVGEWLKGAPKEKPEEDAADKAQRERSRQNCANRLDALCATLEVDPRGLGKLYYQLFHRTCAAIYEAKRFGYRRAIMLVHSFAEKPAPPAMPACFEDFSAFASAVRMSVDSPDSISEPRVCGGVQLRLAWAADKVSS